MRALLDACDIQLASAKRVRFHGSDGFGNNLTVARLYDSQPTDLPPVSLVVGMNGAPLAREHGAPLRLIAPETFGFKCVKWLTRIEVTDQDTPFGTYQDHGFFDEGTLAVSSRGLAPLHQQRISAGPYEVSGFALAGAAPVARVELRMDGGAWLGAELVPIEEIARAEGLDLTGVFQSASGFPYPYRGVWLRWRQLRDFSVGSHTLEIRATDATGNTQPAKAGTPCLRKVPRRLAIPRVEHS